MTAALPHSQSNPFLGDALALYRDPLIYARRRYARYGAIWSTTFVRQPTVVLASAEAQRFIMVEQPRSFSWAGGYDLGKDLFGDGLFMIDDPEHAFQRKLMTPAFGGQARSAYVPLMDTVVTRYLAEWTGQRQVALYPWVRRVAFRLATTLLAGLDPQIDLDQLQRLFSDLLKGATDPLRRDLPLTAYHRALRARRQLDPIILDLIAQRRASPTNDALGLLVAARDDEGQQLSDAQLVGQATTLMFAGYDSTAGTLTWTLAEVLQHQDWYDRVVQACAGDPTAPITDAELKNQPLLDAVINETLRLHPSTPVLMRAAIEDVTIDGHAIKAGTRVVIMIGLTHRLPQYFADPEQWNPQRFLDGEDKQHPYAFVGFGAGSRACIGSGIAMHEIKVALMRLFRSYDLRLDHGQDLHPARFPQMRPRGDVLAHITPKEAR